MELNLVSIGLAVVAGLLSFLSPCVLPLLPAYLSYLGGTTVDALQENSSGMRSRVVAGALLFVAGLATTFTLFGATASLVGRFLIEYQPVVMQVAGVVIIILGLQMMGLFQIPLLQRYARLAWTKPAGRVGPYLMGAAFGVGWSPCIGPFLAGVLGLASQESTVWQGMMLLALYAFGLGIPFIVSALAFQQVIRFLRSARPLLALVPRLGGAVLVVMGILLFSGQLLWLAGFLTQLFGPGLTL
ncbi:MAG: cytochrome c biogenesis protein CcdA [Chloroflexota bacterium]|nr:cytochrome c biogenesis protein CcdA [Dehalococcoidia bacterium]MDW8254429.1 cytochrome c biogenesis protein CcdA [Chloroflexota bacterium]